MGSRQVWDLVATPATATHPKRSLSSWFDQLAPLPKQSRVSPWPSKKQRWLLTTRAVEDLLRTINLLETNVRIVSHLKPIGVPLAARHQIWRISKRILAHVLNATCVCPAYRTESPILST